MQADIDIQTGSRAGCPHPAAEERKYLPRTHKRFVGDDACIVLRTGLVANPMMAFVL